jgi:hypothetical protein
VQTAVYALLDLDSHGVAGRTPYDLHAKEQAKRFAELRALLPGVRAALRTAGYPASEAEHVCNDLRDACIREQQGAADYKAAWDAAQPLPGFGLGPEVAWHTAAWTRAILDVKRTYDRIADLLAVPAPEPPAAAEPATPPGPHTRGCREDLEHPAMKYVVNCFSDGGRLPTQKELAEALHCSERTVFNLKVWRIVRQVRKGGGRPAVASLTSKLEAALAPEEDQLQRLRREQMAEDDDRTPRPRQRKRL